VIELWDSVEPWVFGSIGAVALAAGGAVLRSAFATVPAPARTSLPTESRADIEDLRNKLAGADAKVADLQGQLSAANSAHDAQRAEMVEQRQRAERQVQGAQAEIERLSRELETEKNEKAELQSTLKAAGDERDGSRAKVEALERLVEGVRARSRQLAEELKKLKGE
jgi:chromosome segregation ATPase